LWVLFTDTFYIGFVFQKVGKAQVIDPERDRTLVQDLMNFKEKLDCIIVDCFQANEKFMQAEKDAFDNFINQRANKPAELIGKLLIILVNCPIV